MERVAIYLRKSRADLEAEARGEGETLARHKKTMLEFAKKNGLNIVQIYEEIVSGESIIHRPKMLELLKAVEAKEYDAVLCMDLDRLGRGDMRDQGIILHTFRESGTKIITPRKTYDLRDEFDEEYSEFEAFMARRELKLITRRLQRGRVASVKEGNYIGTRPPYGYMIHKEKDTRTLVPHPEQAPVVKMIFDLYTDPQKQMGSQSIANELNRLGIPSYTGIEWEASVVRNILKNAVYIGKIQWKKIEYKKSAEPGKTKTTRRRDKSEWITVDGKHEPLVSEEVFARAQEIMSKNWVVPLKPKQELVNPLAGLIRCDMCGFSMVLRPYQRQKPHLICQNRLCENKSTRFEYVEERFLEILSEWLAAYKAQWGERKRPQPSTDAIEAKKAALAAAQKEYAELERQKERIHDLLERGIYDEATFLERSQNLAQRLQQSKESIAVAEAALAEETRRAAAQLEIIPKVEHVLKLYRKTNDVKKKNALLKSVLEGATYRKEKHQHGDDFKLRLYPKLPQI